MSTILVADDEESIRNTLGRLLKSSGYEVILAADGVEALEKIKTVKPDLVLLDLMMPKMDGHSVAIQMKQDPSIAQIPVVVLTGYIQLRQLMEIRQDIKPAACLEKPASIDDILETIRKILKS